MSELLKFKMLPASLLLSKFVQGYRVYKYEEYLLEFINSSSYFLKKSNGQKYVHPEKEDGAKCDCISENYKFDFKLLIAPTMAQAKRIFTPSICQPYPCVTMHGAATVTPSDKNYSPINATVLHTWFRKLTVDELSEISKSEDQTISVYKDIKSILESVNTQKNILCMLPYEYTYNNDEDVAIYERRVIETISHDYKSLMEYRFIIQPSYENYIAFIFSDKLIILQYNKSRFKVVDSIPLNKSEIFQQLKRASEIY